jgi:carbon monoxide dehydrogenase subunit G
VRLENRCVVPASPDETWNYLMDVATAARCVPGVVDVSADGEGCYRGMLKARVGPMSISLSGTVKVEEQSMGEGRARFLVEASDRRIGGGVKTEMLVQVNRMSSAETELFIETDTTFMGRLGELGQPVIRRKAQSTIEEFARNLARQLEAGG